MKALKLAYVAVMLFFFIGAGVCIVYSYQLAGGDWLVSGVIVLIFARLGFYFISI